MQIFFVYCHLVKQNLERRSNRKTVKKKKKEPALIRNAKIRNLKGISLLREKI